MTIIAEFILALSLTVLQAVPPPPHASPPPEDRTASNQRKGEAFLAANKAKPDVVTLASGVQYRIVKAGAGKKPTRDDTIVCHFRATQIDGTEFASSLSSRRPAMFAVKKVNIGLAEALQLMPAGSTWEIFIPSQLAYGERGVRGHVGPNATVIYEVELIAVKGADAIAAARTASAGANGGAAKTLRVSFKLDPRLTQGLYMGERWVSPPRYNSAQTGTTVTVDAQALAVDARGRPRKIAALWAPADTEFVSVTSKPGNIVTFTVHRAGESTVRVAGEGLSTVLNVKASQVGQTLQVEITHASPVG